MKRYFPLFCNMMAAVIFGFAYMFVKRGMPSVGHDAVKFLAFRFTVGFVVMSLLAACGIIKISYKNKPVWLPAVCGLLNPLISQTLETSAITHTPTAQLSIFMSLVPVLVVILSSLINKEYPTGRQVFFMAVAALGLMVTALSDGQIRGGNTLGLLLAAGAVTAISLGRVFVRRATVRFTSFELVYFTTGAGAVGFSASSLIKAAYAGELDSFFDGLANPDFVISILYMGVCSCVVAFVCLTYAAAHLPIAVSSATGLLSNVISICAGVFLLGETLKLTDWIGAVMILSGLFGMSQSYNSQDPKGNAYQSPESRKSPEA